MAIFSYLRPAQVLLLGYCGVVLCGVFGIAWYIGQLIEQSVIHRTSVTTALYVDSFVAPHLRELAQTGSLPPERINHLRGLLQNTPLGQQIVGFKIWSPDGRILYSSNEAYTGQIFPVQGGLARAWRGEVSSKFSALHDAENVLEREHYTRLLETYTPVHHPDSGIIIAVAEFYQRVDDLQREIETAQRQSWLVVGTVVLGMYLVMAILVLRADSTIKRQNIEMNNQIARLTELLSQNMTLHERVRRAAARTTTLNEYFLRRISAELHDGPAQDLGLALMRLDHALACSEGKPEQEQNLHIIQDALHHALQEVRAISAGLRHPQLERLSLEEALRHVALTHERRTGTSVQISLGTLPAQVPLSIKMTLYRIVQEALHNAFRHAGGKGQQVTVHATASELQITISDQGLGFDTAQYKDEDVKLGLLGMRERVESLGGVFKISSEIGAGTCICATIPLYEEEIDSPNDDENTHRFD